MMYPIPRQSSGVKRIWVVYRPPQGTSNNLEGGNHCKSARPEFLFVCDIWVVLPRGRTDVNRMNADRHARGKTGIDRADLGVDVV